MVSRRDVLAMLGAAALAACGRGRHAGASAARAFYYWRTTFALSAAERRALVELAIRRLYVRMFDVEWNAERAGVSLIGAIQPATGQRTPDGVDIVPVVYLRQAVFGKLDRAGIAKLAATTWTEVDDRCRRLGATYRELQLDCDWTDTTQAAFFAYLRALRAGRRDVTLSSTIRLHQVKYRERTGVPPVERGMLMFYNMGKFSADPDARAIFDADAAARYLARIADYPLPLDVALPIWSWTLHLRDERVEGLLQATDPDALPALDFVTRTAPDRFTVTRNAFLQGRLLREGDVLKIERMGPAESRQAAAQLAPHLPSSAARTVALFDLSERNLARHGLDSLADLYETVR